ncbi:Sec-independent protein translocase protein TatB [Bosea sp. (in: a-proteobacteria)]|jgi:sec-independent protein translocase protein TatB|uniref:Sec-independent protein translocase protein TatB n=1 Tax=Bosea sp. (in: a-proteobacteria) TaxID=1871050 RepID=UPI002DDD3E57|nr:Sec-independent protein translocase protein TatB [Bosea sp. (in: a-proteobacteria)]HEV2508097.1 Sec-independent protein translocase protein TatB [Bosea sp. (in: a-proteobacteria)]
MFDIAWSEMLLIGGVALVVIGPKELPGALRTAGQAIGKIRRMAAEFQGQFNDAMRDAELHDLKKQVDDIGNSIQASTNFDPIEPMKDFGAADASKPTEDKAMQEAEATLAALPAPELPAPVSIEPAPVAEPAPEEKPKRRRKTVATEEPAVPAEVVAEEPPAKPARKRKAKAAEAEGGETA